MSDPATCKHLWAAPTAVKCPECLAAITVYDRVEAAQAKQRERWSKRRPVAV